MSLVFSQSIFFHHLDLSASSVERHLTELNDDSLLSNYEFEFSGIAWFVETSTRIDLQDLTSKSFDDFHLKKFIASLREEGIDIKSISIEHAPATPDMKLDVNGAITIGERPTIDVVKIYGIAIGAALLTVVVGVMLYRRNGSIDAFYSEEEFSFSNELDFRVIEPSSLNNGSNSTSFRDNKSQQIYNVRYSSFSEDGDFSSESSFNGEGEMPAHKRNSFGVDLLYSVHTALPTYPVNSDSLEKKGRSHRKKSKRGESLSGSSSPDSGTALNKKDNSQVSRDRGGRVMTGTLIEFPAYDETHEKTIVARGDPFRIQNTVSDFGGQVQYQHDENQIAHQQPIRAYRHSLKGNVKNRTTPDLLSNYVSHIEPQRYPQQGMQPQYHDSSENSSDTSDIDDSDSKGYMFI